MHFTFHNVAIATFTPSLVFPIIRGAEIVAQTTVEITPDQSLDFHWGSESTSQLVLSVGVSHCVSRPVSVETTSYQMMGSSSVESTGSPSIPTLRSLRRKPPSASSTVPLLRVMSHSPSSLPSAHKKHCHIHLSHCQEELSLQMTAPFKLPVSLHLQCVENARPITPFPHTISASALQLTMKSAFQWYLTWN